MKELDFIKDDTKDVWVATAEVAADFNIRVKRKTPSRIVIEISTVEPVTDDDYSQAWDRNEPAVFDHDFDAKVYPKYLRIVSYSETFGGSITEVED